MNLQNYENIIPNITYFIHRKCSPDWRIEECVTNCFDVLYVLNGSAIYKIGEKEYKVNRGSLLCIPVGLTRSAIAVRENPMECYAVSFRTTDPSCEPTLSMLPMISHIGVQLDIVSLYQDLNSVWLQRKCGYILKSKAILMLILHNYFNLLVFKNSPTFIDSRINNAIHYITKHYAEDITIHTLAEISKLNPTYFGILFKQSMGVTFRQYITSVRLNYAESLLKSGEHNVTDVTALCGFSDVCYFCRVYKKSRGISPSNVFRNSENLFRT